ncbi:MAG: DNA topoisomerase subunit B [Promethearchaeota archaeon]
MLNKDEYNAENIQVLKGLEGIRKRPSMYIGSTGKEGWHHLIWEVIDNSIDEALAGYCTKINICLNKDGSVTIEDNGRGIPTEIHPDYNKPTLEVIVQNLHAGGKFNKGSYKISGGLHGVGLSVVSALSEYMEVEVFRDNKYHYQKFIRGQIDSPMKVIPIEDYFKTERYKYINRLSKYKSKESEPSKNGKSAGETKDVTNEKNHNKENMDDKSPNGNGSDIDFEFELGIPPNMMGTRITFKPDPEVFKDIKNYENARDIFDYKIINNRVRHLAYLNPMIEIQLYDELYNNYDYHAYEGGIIEFVEYLNIGYKPLFDRPIYIKGEKENVIIEVAFQYTESYLENILSFVNNVQTHEGGTHVTGLKYALTKVLNKYIQSNFPKKMKNTVFQGSDTREGLTLILSVKVPEPQFEGQTKTKLGNENVQRIVSSIVIEELSDFLDKNPSVATKIVNKCLLAQKARIASKKARDQTRRKNALDSSRLPGKLADCSIQDPSKAEIFIVEGDSAGGSAKQGRDRETQAILPLRGKILNVEKASMHKIHENKEIISMISAIGTGIYQNEESKFQIDKLRYHKIIIMTDADVDGAHIKTLLLTFFFRYMRPLIDKGYIYVAVPPLYKVKYKKSVRYIYEEKNLQPYLAELMEKYKIDDKSKIKVQRFKGLGEMNPEELWETTMNPKTRKLIQIKYRDFTESHQLFNTLMGDDVLPRKQYIMENYRKVQNLDI